MRVVVGAHWFRYYAVERESACIGAKVVRPIKLRKARGLFRMSQT